MLCGACSFGAPEAGVIDGPAGDGSGGPGDRDGDGVADGDDLCPDHADSRQRDHDGDRHGDVCDRCPFLASDADPDLDGDGVGDACDPRPNMAGDVRALWIGFHDEDADLLADPAQWGQTGTWSIVDGWARGTSGGFALLRSTVDVPRAVATSRIRLDDVSSGNTAVAILSGLVGPLGGSTQLYQCALFQFQARIGAHSISTGIDSDMRTSWPVEIADGAIVDVVSRFGGMFACTFSAPSTTASTLRGATDGEVELLVQDATASFDYLFVVGQGI
jgi:hypothetical protein